jgi:hypothetical protein
MQSLSDDMFRLLPSDLNAVIGYSKLHVRKYAGLNPTKLSFPRPLLYHIHELSHRMRDFLPNLKTPTTNEEGQVEKVVRL